MFWQPNVGCKTGDVGAIEELVKLILHFWKYSNFHQFTLYNLIKTLILQSAMIFTVILEDISVLILIKCSKSEGRHSTQIIVSSPMLQELYVGQC